MSDVDREMVVRTLNCLNGGYKGGDSLRDYWQARLDELEAAAKEGEAEAEPTPVPEQKDVLARLAVLESRADAAWRCHDTLRGEFANHNHWFARLAPLKSEEENSTVKLTGPKQIDA